MNKEYFTSFPKCHDLAKKQMIKELFHTPWHMEQFLKKSNISEFSFMVDELPRGRPLGALLCYTWWIASPCSGGDLSLGGLRASLTRGAVELRGRNQTRAVITSSAAAYEGAGFQNSAVDIWPVLFGDQKLNRDLFPLFMFLFNILWVSVSYFFI